MAMENVSRDNLGVMEFVTVTCVMMKSLVTSGNVRPHLSSNVNYLEYAWIQVWFVMDMQIVEKMTGRVCGHCVTAASSIRFISNNQ